jgi:hypothetical protein
MKAIGLPPGFHSLCFGMAEMRVKQKSRFFDYSNPSPECCSDNLPQTNYADQVRSMLQLSGNHKTRSPAILNSAQLFSGFNWVIGSES